MLSRGILAIQADYNIVNNNNEILYQTHVKVV